MSFFRYNNKQVYYSVRGDGETVVLLHGNTASSKMFRGIARPLSRMFRVVLVDFPGHGKSERPDRVPVDFWYENGMAVCALIDHLEIPKVSLIGSSGGALAALNVGLQRPELVDKIVADSFDGERSFVWESLLPPVLLTGSMKDERIPDIHEVYMDLEKRLKRKKIVLFPGGGHLAMLSNKAPFLEIVKKFLVTGE